MASSMRFPTNDLLPDPADWVQAFLQQHRRKHYWSWVQPLGSTLLLGLASGISLAWLQPPIGIPSRVLWDVLVGIQILAGVGGIWLVAQYVKAVSAEDDDA